MYMVIAVITVYDIVTKIFVRSLVNVIVLFQQPPPLRSTSMPSP